MFILIILYTICPDSSSMIRSFVHFVIHSTREGTTYYGQAKSQHKPVLITQSVIQTYEEEMEKIFVSTNVQEQRDLLERFVEKIIIKDGGIEIVYYAPGVKFPSSTLPDA